MNAASIQLVKDIQIMLDSRMFTNIDHTAREMNDIIGILAFQVYVDKNTVQYSCTFVWLSVLAFCGDVYNVRLWTELNAATTVLSMLRSFRCASILNAVQNTMSYLFSFLRCITV